MKLNRFIPLLILGALKSCLVAGTISFNATRVEVEEGDFEQAVLTVRRNGATGVSIGFSCTIQNQTDDFYSKSQPIVKTGTIAANQKAAKCGFFVENDTQPEGAEIFPVELRLVFGNDTVLDVAYIVITSNDDGNGIVGFDVPNGVSFHEPRTNSDVQKLPIKRSVAAFGRITVKWRVITAAASSDINRTSGIVVFRDGEDVKDLEFSVRPDLLIERDEDFEFELTNVTGGARLSTSLSRVLVRILANDIPARFAVRHVIVPENQTNVTLWVYRGLDVNGVNLAQVSLDRSSSVAWYLKPDGALGNQDFYQTSGTVVFGKDETRKSISVNIIDDTIPEKSENFTVHLSNLSADISLASPSVCTIQILHSDDHVGVFSLSGNGNITVSEDDGNNVVDITINRTAGAYGTVEVTWLVESSHGNLSTQISPLNGTVTFGDGEREKSVRITITEDMIPEEAFWFVVALATVSGGRVTNNPWGRSKRVIVRDSDDVYGVFEFSNDTYQTLSLTSQPRMVNFAISRNGGSYGTVRVSYLVKYFAVDGVDHTTSIGIKTSGTVSFSTGQVSASVGLNIPTGGFIRANSVFRITLTSLSLLQPAKTLVPPSTPRFGSRSILNLTVHPQYADGEIGFDKTSVTVTEPDDGQTKRIDLQVRRDGTLSRASLRWSVVGLTTSSDLTPTSGNLFFGKGVSSLNITIQILPDTIPELDERFTIRLHNVSGANHKLQAGASELILTIKRNDNAGGVFQFDNIESNILSEARGSHFEITVLRIGGDLDKRFVKVMAINGGKDDFISVEAEMIFDIGVRTMSHIFYVKDDNKPETNETFTFRLDLVPFGPSSLQGTLGNPTEFKVTILENDDPNGVVVFANTSLSIVESKGEQRSASFVVERRRGLFGDVIVTWNITSEGDPTLDISPTFGKVRFSENEQFKTIRISSLEDKIPELHENFTVTLINAEGGARIGVPHKAELTILRNDDAIEFKAPALVRVKEGDRATFTILRHGRHNEAVTVSYATQDDSATASGKDYAPVNETIVFASGETQKIISVFILDDNQPETDENFTIVLTSSTGDTSIYGNTVAVVTIAANDDPNGIFHFDGNSELNKTASEGKPVAFRVVRDRGIYGIVSVHWQVYQVFANGSHHALTSRDFEQTSGALVFENLEQTKNLSLDVLADDMAEYGETFRVVLANVTGGSPGPGGKLSASLTSAYIRIPTNDNPYGLFAFAPSSLNASVAEDTRPGYEYEATVNLSVVRKRGKDRDVGVSWCIYKAEVADKLTDIWDLVFLSKIEGAGIVDDREKRPNTGSTALEFAAVNRSYAIVESLPPVPAREFTISAWLKPRSGHKGTVLAKVLSNSGNVAYSLKIDARTNVNLTMTILVTGDRTLTASEEIGRGILDGNWHNIIIAVGSETGIAFYYDGRHIETNSAAKFNSILDGEGDLYVGVARPNNEHFEGLLQDVKIFTKNLRESEVYVISQPVKDIIPINGYLDYPEHLASRVVALTSTDNNMTEPEKSYSVILVSSRGGADIDKPRNSRAKLTVLKSDNANGIFGFSSAQSLSKMVSETAGIVSFVIERTVGFVGEVTVNWMVFHQNGSRASDDFINSSGSLVFANEEKQKNLTVFVMNDKKPELSELFRLRLVSARSNDGTKESTATSGASVSLVFSVANITIEENDSPYGLLQFANEAPKSRNISPSTVVFRMEVRESVGKFKLYIERAQGILGDIECSWQMSAITADENKDYVNAAGTVSLRAGVLSTSINISIIDNDKPELNKTFRVWLYDAKNGAEIGAGGTAIITIKPSDDAFGVVSFTSHSLARSLEEGESIVLEVHRSGGTLGDIVIGWAVDNAGDELQPTSGMKIMKAGERYANITIVASNDLLPELSKSYFVRLVNVTSGRLASRGIVSNVTILANDAPFGLFEFDPSLLAVEEASRNITVTIVRRQGTMGTTRVYYTSVRSTVAVEGVMYNDRAEEDKDFHPVSGFVDFRPNQTAGSFVVTILDDVIPEDNETIVVNLTSVTLLGGQDSQSDGYPQIGSDRLLQLVILQNDNASGIVHLSSSAVTVKEGNRGTFLNITRSGGIFGEVTVDIEVTAVDSDSSKDYRMNASKVTLSDGQQTATVPIAIIDDEDPERSETFIVRLTSRDRTVIIGHPSQCTVTIEENDYPYGLIGFSSSSLSSLVKEPSSGNQVVKLHVIREYGTLDVVWFQWNVTLSGRLAISDVQLTQGNDIIPPGVNMTSFDIVILADNVPEVDEVLLVTLSVTKGKAELNLARSQANVTIQLNDEAHGVIEFSYDSYTVREENHNKTAHIPIVRKRGTHGDVIVHYSTLQDLSPSPAIPNQDYVPLVNASVTIADGSNSSSVDVIILGDVRPELSKHFTIDLEYVELVGNGVSSQPRLGAKTSANVTIEDDDYFYGLFKVFGEKNQSQIVVNETLGLSVTLYIWRLGGDTGEVSVMVIISPESTARADQDFTGSDFILPFKPGDHKKSITLSILSDDVPERDETIIMKLVNPTAGSSVAQDIGNNVTIIIQANDVVAGCVKFNKSSQAVIVREGEMVTLALVRTSPAAGTVTVDWLIRGDNVTKDFNETFGTALFKEGERTTYIRTQVLADNTPEIEKQFQVILRNPVTSGISKTGAAEVSSQMGTANLTVAASNEPHGVIEFQQSSRRVVVKESGKIEELSVARLFGNIGTIRLYFAVINSSLHSLSLDERLATIGADVAVDTSSVLIKNGVSIGAIPLTIVNDTLAELDEYFIVNITNVELVRTGSQPVNNETFIPPRLGQFLTSEVKIEKNDGPQGILIFSPARVNVKENIGSFNLTVLRTQGTFGEIEVNYYVRRRTIDENDFSLYGKLEAGGEGTLTFLVGQRTQNVTIFINDDTIPEGDELFEVRLKRKKNQDFELGRNSIAYVTVLVNDAGNGIFRFSQGSLELTVDEPGSRQVGTTRANFVVERENGTIGDVVIGWSIANLTAMADFKEVNGTVLFKNGEQKNSFDVETVVDTTPEKEERFLVVLSVIRGGGELKSPSKAWLTVSENDEPYGELDFAVAPETLNIEETVGYVEIKVLRHKGTYGTITVDYQTVSQSADSSEGGLIKFGVFQGFQTINARKWYPFSAYDKQFLLFGAGNSSSGTHGNDDAYLGSGLYYWQGLYTRLTNITTNNPVQFETFHINGQHFIAVANHGSENNYEINSTIFKMFPNGTVSHHQNVPTQAASDVKFFRPAGSADSYLVFANTKDNTGNTDILTKVYKWSNSLFVEHGRGLTCRGASGLALFTVNRRDFLAISSLYDSVNVDFRSRSVIFEWKNNQFKSFAEIATNGANGVEYFMLDDEHYLLFVNSRSYPDLYKWSTDRFVLQANVPISDAKSARMFSMDEEAFLVSSSLEGSSHLWKWNSQGSNFQFYTNLTEYGTEDVQPITIQDSVNHNITLLAVAMTATSESRLLQPANMSAQADFIPRKGRLVFNNEDTELSFFVTIFNDSISEPDETFLVTLSNATGGAVIGPNGNLEVNILSNGNPYGRIEFAMRSLNIVVDEKLRDWVLYLEVLREQGSYGKVIVAWNKTDNVSGSVRHGDNDVYPASGEIVFLEGETKKTINVTIVADDIPEVNEVFEVSLTSLVADGSNLPNQGATINSARSTSTIIIRANDEPHGIVGWQRTNVLAQESEATNSTVQLIIERQLGSIGDIKVLYSTREATTNASANERPAVPNHDFVPVSSEVIMTDGVNLTNISIHVIHDNNAEVNEVFYVNITAVQLLESYAIPPENSPRINPSSQVAKVVISENDNTRGELNFNISHLVDPRTGIIKINEDIGELRIPFVRTGGTYGTVGFEYRLVPNDVNDNDYAPTKGEIVFQPNETSRVLVINITDDDTAEVAELFRLEMTQPIGGARLGTKREVTVEIRASDQPCGVFEFSSVQTVLLEEGRDVRLRVVRLQGSFCEVHVSWNVSSGAFPDIYPANGTLTFHKNVTSQDFRIRARADDIPDGVKIYVCYLVSADNGGVIGSERKLVIRIDANDDGYGLMAVNPVTSLVYVGEPDSPSSSGRVDISLIRKAGTYGTVPVDWNLVSDDHVSGQAAKTFNTTKGTIVFDDGVRMKNITLYVKQDSDPEETANYTLRLVGILHARIDESASRASVVVVSSDHPYGIIDFVGAMTYNVSEDVGNVILKVVRNKGNTGRLVVTINIASSGATEDDDFSLSPKVLTIEDQKDTGSINVSIRAEDLPELSESFSVSLGKIDLVTSRYINYGYMNGLQVDMPPEVGPRSRVVFTILKNDDANGVVEFRQSRLVVHEHDRRLIVSIVRTGGSYGVIRAQYTVTNVTAEYGKDYLLSDGEVVFSNDQHTSNLSIILFDDKLPEDRESFRLDLTSVSGGARLGDRRTLEIVLETSDNPDGLFGFQNKTRLVFANPANTLNLALGVSRIGGARSFVRVSIRVFKIFPSPGVITADIDLRTSELTFQTGEFGPKMCELSVLPFLQQREVEEHFQVSIISVSGNASIDSLSQNITLVIQKRGMPNGLFGFISTSATQTISEDSSDPVVLTVDRKEGREGTVEVKWAVSDTDGTDFVNNEGTLTFLADEERKQIRLRVKNDNIPELNEKFTVTLLSANGGGDIDPSSSNATVVIRASDDPHGIFRIGSNTQRITVENDLSRVLNFKIQRTGGRFGDVRVNYQLVYSRNYPGSLDGFLVIRDGEGEKTKSVVLDQNSFLYFSSHFTLTLSGVMFQGDGVSDISPKLNPSSSTENIPVPELAANSLVKFKDGYRALTVNQDNQVSRVIVTRDGLYGNTTVSIASGYPEDEYSGFTKGKAQASLSSLTFQRNVREMEFSIKVTPVLVPRQKMVFAVYLSGVSTPPNVHGGAKIDESAQTSLIEPGGVFVVSPETQNIVVKENETAVLTVYRLFSTLGTIEVEYTTQRTSTALPNQDYLDTSSTLTMVDGEYRKEIRIGIKNDNLPELVESFSVQLTGVTGTNARLGSNKTSVIAIEDDDSPHGVLSFRHHSITVQENITDVDVIVSRTGGAFGDVAVLVRSIGGGEPWTSGTREDIGKLLDTRKRSKIAKIRQDYGTLNERILFKSEVPTPSGGQNHSVQLHIFNDEIPEVEEEIFLFLSEPTGGAILANPSTGGQSWAVVKIAGNDLLNGKIYFVTSSLTLDEDNDPAGEMKVMRTHNLGTANVLWQTFNTKEILEETSGKITFAPGETTAVVRLKLKQDNDPELPSNFTVKLMFLVDTPEAVIDSASNVVMVTVTASDDPAGLIGFDQDSRNTAIDVSTNSAKLYVARAKGTYGRITVSYTTTMLAEKHTDNDLVINRAIESKDYIKTQGMLVFEPGERKADKEIVIELTPNTASDTPYPKAFNVTLFNLSTDARLHEKYSKTMVIISNAAQTTQFLKLRSDSLKTPLSNDDMTRIMQSLYSTLNQDTLQASHVTITANFLNTILDDFGERANEKDRVLTNELSNLFMNVFDVLLDPERADFKGQSQFTEPFVKYAFALLYGENCPGSLVVKKNGKYATVEGRRRYEKDINSLKIKSSSSKNFFTYPSNIYQQITNSAGQSDKCADVHFIEYRTTHWFNKDNNENILNNQVLSTSVRNTSDTNPGRGSSYYRIYTEERRVTPKGAECLKWHKNAWDSSICSVKDETEDYVECECKHFSNFAVRGESDDRVGYEFYFFIAAFICMISFFLVIVSHHTCSLENTFSAKLLMHMFFAGFVLHLLVVVAAYISPDLTDKPEECTTLGILIHYFLLAHFCWIFVQCCNLWRILVLNDEHTNRKFIFYFMLGWGIPVLCIALYVIITHALYDWDITEIYADVHNNGDMCFIPNIYGVLASVMGPVLLFLLTVGVVTTQAYQVTIQWKLYDDIFRGHHNIKEVLHLWIVFFGITMTWLFGGLHLAFGKMWLAILFSIFDVVTGLYVFMVYFVLRNQCRRKYRNEAYLLHASSPSLTNPSPTDYLTERSVMYDAQSMNSVPKSELRLSPPAGNEWEDYEYEGETPKNSRRGYNDAPLAQINPLYDSWNGRKLGEESNEDVIEKEEEELSEDLNELVRALKTGETLSDEHDGKDVVELLKQDEMRTDSKLELRRVSIADTHV